MSTPTPQFTLPPSFRLFPFPGKFHPAMEPNIQSSAPTPRPLSTPASCVADFCLIPIGTPTASVSHEIADVQRLLRTSGLVYEMHSAGTTVEGSWDAVMSVIGQAHSMLHEKGIMRIQTDIRVGSRIDKKQTFSEKVTTVNKLLAADEKGE